MILQTSALGGGNKQPGRRGRLRSGARRTGLVDPGPSALHVHLQHHRRSFRLRPAYRQATCAARGRSGSMTAPTAKALPSRATGSTSSAVPPPWPRTRKPRPLGITRLSWHARRGRELQGVSQLQMVSRRLTVAAGFAAATARAALARVLHMATTARRLRRVRVVRLAGQLAQPGGGQLRV